MQRSLAFNHLVCHKLAHLGQYVAETCRDAVATLSRAALSCTAIITIVLPMAALTDLVELRKAWINAKPVWDAMAFINIANIEGNCDDHTKPVEPLGIKVHIMPKGRLREAPQISSAALRQYNSTSV